MKKRENWLLIPIVLMLCVIWGNSLLSGDESAAVSGGLLQKLMEWFPFLGGMSEFFLRKLGHFSEFAALGWFAAWFFLLQGQRGIHRFTLPLLLGSLAANADELIQTFTPDRGPSVVDVWIDIAGACTGITALLLIAAVIMNRRKRKES